MPQNKKKWKRQATKKPLPFELTDEDRRIMRVNRRRRFGQFSNRETDDDEMRRWLEANGIDPDDEND